MHHARSTGPRALHLLVVVLMVAGLLVSVGRSQTVLATHFRAASLTWTKAGPTAATFKSRFSGRRDYPYCNSGGITIPTANIIVGSVIYCVEVVNFGDGAVSAPDFRGNPYTVTSVDAANNVLTAEATVTHIYATNGPYTAFVQNCCRISPPTHINNADGDIRIETRVNFALATKSPDSSLSPIVDCPKYAVCRFQVPGVAEAGQTVKYRLSSPAEAAGTGIATSFVFRQPGAAGSGSPNPASIDPVTGVYVWNTTGAALAPAGSNTFYSTQVTIESYTGATLASKVAVDFFIRLSDTASPDRAPVFTAPTPDDATVLTTTVGAGPVTFSVAASDPDSADTVTLGLLGKPATATFTTTAANPASGSFSWTPTSGGTFLLSLTAQDQLGLGATQRSVTIAVTANEPPTIAADQASVSVSEGTTAAMTGVVGDPNGDSASLSASVGAVVNNGDGTWSWSYATTDGPTQSQTVTITADDGRGGTSLATFGLTVNNVAPTATWTPPTMPINEGGSFTLALTNPVEPSSVDTAAGLTYAFDCGDGSGYSAFGASSSVSCPTTDNGARTVGGKVQDKDGGVSEYTSSVSVDNVAPTATWSAVAGDEGSPIALSLTNPVDPSSADVAAGFAYAFDCGDGAGANAAPSGAVSCPTTDNGSRTVGGSITDKDGGVSTYSSTVQIANVAPSATFTAQSPVNEGVSFTLTLTNPSDPSSADTTAGFSYAFDCGAGFGSFGSTASTSCATDDNGTRPVGGQIKDKDGGVTTYTDAVTIANVAPTATFAAQSPVNEGGAFTLALTNPSDPSSADVAAGFSYAFDCGDGNGYGAADSASSASCAAPDNASRTVKGTITDKDGDSTEYTATVVVDNVAPTATFAAQTPVDEGSTFTVSLSGALDASGVDATAGFTYAFDCGSGYGPFGGSSSVSCPTTDNGSRAVGGKIRDKDGGVTAYNGSVTINNVAPTITSLTTAGQTAALSSAAVTVTGTATDPSSADTAAGFTWQWSVDGSAYAQGPNPNSFTFTTCGVHTVSATATDKDGGVSAPVSASPVTVYAARFQSPLTEGVNNMVQKGRVVPVKVSVGCGNTALTGLSPTIQLLKGNVSPATESGAAPIATLSSSSADTTGLMRANGDGYIYNLQVPGDASATSGAQYTVRVRPFGDSNPSAAIYIVLQIK